MKLGIIGGGQLARMLALSAEKLHIQTIVLDPDSESSASQITDHITANINDPAAIKKLALSVDVLTYELEHIDASLIKESIGSTPIHPNLKALCISQDRLIEKNYLSNLGLKVANYFQISSIDDLQSISHLNNDHYLKIRRSGFDGRGQIKINNPHLLQEAFNQFEGRPCILEEAIPYEFECSMIAARNTSGTFLFYPLITNTHQDGILQHSEINLNLGLLQAKAESIAKLLMSSLDYVGIIAIEFFVLGGHLIINEIAPRVHNSGHWSIEGANCSQFEAHLRCLFDISLPLLSIEKNIYMVNILGTFPDINGLKNKKNIFVHGYGKSERLKRKIGHITIINSSKEDKLDISNLVSS
jgi:5-(carboxyamino)imidazole ribonucleotide synthase